MPGSFVFLVQSFWFSPNFKRKDKITPFPESVRPGGAGGRRGGSRDGAAARRGAAAAVLGAFAADGGWDRVAEESDGEGGTAGRDLRPARVLVRVTLRLARDIGTCERHLTLAGG
jgi:hypothetical protein